MSFDEDREYPDPSDDEFNDGVALLRGTPQRPASQTIRTKTTSQVHVDRQRILGGENATMSNGVVTPVIERYDARGAPIKPVKVGGETVYFFGCWNGQLGHYLFDPYGASYRHNGLIPWANIDGALCHGADERGDADIHRQIEGDAKLHHLDGWTALAWWDRSVDARYGSNAALFAKGTHAFDGMIHIMRNWFPNIIARFEYAIRP